MNVPRNDEKFESAQTLLGVFTKHKASCFSRGMRSIISFPLDFLGHILQLSKVLHIARIVVVDQVLQAGLFAKLLHQRTASGQIRSWHGREEVVLDLKAGVNIKKMSKPDNSAHPRSSQSPVRVSYSVS